MAGVFNGSLVRTYVNGTLAGESALQGSVELTGQPILVGENLSPGDWNWFNGVIDDVRVYDRALSADDVMKLYNFVPPSIIGVTGVPSTPNYDEEVTVTATIKDDLAVDEALLSYSHDLTWHNVSMSKSDDTFNATIPVQPYGILVQYKIQAKDTDGDWAISDLYSYIVEDFTAPSVALSRIPVHPLPEQKVKVYANITEPANASGIRSPVLFSYRANGGPWWNTTMIFNNELGLFETTIPAYEKYDLVEYLVKAVDNAANINTTAVHYYEVLRCDVNHDAIVDIYDIISVAVAYGSTPLDPNWNPNADTAQDNVIDIYDLLVVAVNFGRTWTPLRFLHLLFFISTCINNSRIMTEIDGEKKKKGVMGSLLLSRCGLARSSSTGLLLLCTTLLCWL